jgi:hypothetical protein
VGRREGGKERRRKEGRREGGKGDSNSFQGGISSAHPEEYAKRFLAFLNNIFIS